MKKRVLFYAPIAARTGLGQAAADYLLALNRTERVHLNIRSLVDADTDDLPARYGELLPLLSDEVLPADICVIHTTPRWGHEFVTTDLTPAPGVKKVLLTVWESDSLNPTEVNNLNKHFDLVLVPTQFNKDVFVRSGIKNVEILPHAFDKDHWFVEDAARPADPFVFFTAGVWAARKNLPGLLTAYWAEFEPHENVLLRMLVAFPKEDEIESLVRRLGLESLAPVEILKRRHTDAEVRGLHLNSHAYVSATRGEGWNLPAFEAALVGNPVIVPRWSGHREFLDGYAGTHYCDFQLTPCVICEQLGREIKIGSLTVKPLTQRLNVGVTAKQNWAEPDLCDLKRQMRKVFTERPARLTKHRGELIEKYSYPEVGKRFADILEAL